MIQPQAREKLFANWKQRNITGCYCISKEEAAEEILRLVPLSVTVGISGSRTLEQLEIAARLAERGNSVFNQYKAATRAESLQLRRRGARADYFLCSANAVAESGELVFFSGYGNRTAGVSYSENVIVVCGENKITPALEEALRRSREYATLLNCRRLSWESFCFKQGFCRQEECLFPAYKRMCAQVLIIEAEVAPGRLRVILVGEELGF